MKRQIALFAMILVPGGLLGQEVFPSIRNGGGSGFAVTQSGNLPQAPGVQGTTLMQGEVIFPPQYQGGTLLQQNPGMMQQVQPVPDKVVQHPEVREPTIVERWYQDNLFHYSWIDAGEDQGLRIHRLELTNAWADMRAANFFSRPIEEPTHNFDAGISFAVQWMKEFPTPLPYPRDPYLPPVVYDLYADFGWRGVITPGWMIDLVASPGLSTDFRVTPPDGFRMRGHAITILEMLPNLRGVLGVWYLNRNTTKILPVAGFTWLATDVTRVEAVFPQPRIVHTLGCWRGNTWEMSVGGEFGGGGWAYKDPENERDTIDYKDFRLLFGLSRNGSKGQATLQAGYAFSRQVQYGTNPGYDWNPGNAWMVRVGWDF